MIYDFSRVRHNYGREGKRPCVEINARGPLFQSNALTPGAFGSIGRRSGKQKILRPSPPYRGPINEYNAGLLLTDRHCPFASRNPIGANVPVNHITIPKIISIILFP